MTDREARLFLVRASRGSIRDFHEAMIEIVIEGGPLPQTADATLSDWIWAKMVVREREKKEG